MHTKPHKLFLLLFVITQFFIVNFSIAQNKQHSGAIISVKGDTLKGFITYRDSRVNPESVYFSETGNDKNVKKLVPSNIKGFIIEDEPYPYITYAGDVSINPLEISKLPYYNDRNYSKSILKKDTVFLRQIVKGKISLYEYEDFKFHYFLQNDNDSIFELLNKFYMVSAPQEYKVNNKLYLGQIDSFLRVNKIPVPEKLRTVEYNKYDFIKLVMKLNGQSSESTGIIEFKSRDRKGRIGIGGGISALKYHFTSDLTPDRDYRGKSFNPSINFYYDYKGLINLNRFFGRVDIQWQKLNCIAQDTKNDKIRYTNQLVNLVFTPSINYSIVQRQIIEVYIGAGLGININLKNEGAPWVMPDPTFYPNYIDYYNEPHKVRKVWDNPNLHAGIILSRKLDLNVSYDFLSAPGGLSDYSGSNITLFSLRANYLFSL